MAFGEKSNPLRREDPHEVGVGSRDITGTERGHHEAVFVAIRGEEGELLLIAFAHFNLVITGPGVQTDEVEAAVGIAQVLNTGVAARNGELVGKSDGIQ